MGSEEAEGEAPAGRARQAVLRGVPRTAARQEDAGADTRGEGERKGAALQLGNAFLWPHSPAVQILLQGNQEVK